MSQSINAEPAPRTQYSPYWLLFAVAWLAHAGFSMVGWENTLLSKFQFRQLQTAMTVLFFPPTGFTLDYATPLFGPPWSIPLEFPAYQASVAWFANFTGMALDPAGRLVSWLWFQASLPAVFLLLGSLQVARPKRWITLTLLVTSPIYLFYSRAFLIESCVFCFSVWFLAAYCRWLTKTQIGWLVTAAFTGVMAAAIKPTTLLGFSVGAGLFTLGYWWSGRSGARPKKYAFWSIARRSILAFSIPVAAGIAWQTYSAHVRAQNPEAAFLDVMFGYFSFGDIAQRFSYSYWQRTTEVWLNGVLSEAGAILMIFLSFIAPRRQRTQILALLLTFLSSQLVFSNLFAVHDYYFYANGLFMIMALGVAISSLHLPLTPPFWGQAMILGLLVIFQLGAYARVYLPFQRENTPPLEISSVLNDITKPDDMVVILGQDWDAVTPYYAERRALMLIAGRERDEPAIRTSMERLDPSKIGAVVLFGHLRSDQTFVERTMPWLDLGGKPFLLANDLQIGIWVPRAEQEALRASMPLNPYPTFDLAARSLEADGRAILSAREIMRMREFEEFNPRPIGAMAFGGFSHSEIEGQRVLNLHAPSEITLHVKPDTTNISLEFGVHHAAYVNGNYTDGVGFSVVDLRHSGEETILYQQFLDPMKSGSDQGTHHRTVAIPSGLAGEIVVRVLPGPANNSSCDWAYLGKVSIE